MTQAATHVTSSESETQAVAAALAPTLTPGAVLLLHGHLGAGKTAFVRGLASGLGIDVDAVSSPTFTIVQEYRGGRLPLFHADLYRLGSGEVDDLGLDHIGADEGVVAIEWAERLPRPVPGAWHVRLSQGDADDARVIVIEAPAVPPTAAIRPAPAPEIWLRGPLPDVAPVLQPVAHALLQVAEDASRALHGLTPAQVWERPGGAGSVGFHARHLQGSLDRLLTYARGEGLREEQFTFLRAESEPGEPPATAAQLDAEVRAAIDAALAQVRATSVDTLFEGRTVGRARLPTTVFGLLVHAAEHSSRHAGQMITTSILIRNAQR